MGQAIHGDLAIGAGMESVAREIGLAGGLEAAANGVGVARHIQVAAHGEVLDAHEFARVIEVIEDVFEGHRLAAAHHKANEADAHDAAGLRHFANGFVGLGAQVAGDQGAAVGMGEDHRLGGGFQRIESGLVAAVGHVHRHAHFLPCAS